MAATPLSPNAIGAQHFLVGSNVEMTITATAGGGQANARPLAAQINDVLTVASGNDSVALPKITGAAFGSNTLGQVGTLVLVRNASANSMQVFGASPDTINDVATGTGVAVGAGKAALFWSYNYTQSTNVGEWVMLLSA